jgi:hypothetical protein
MRLPVGDSDDGSIVVNHTASTQPPPPSKKLHALDRLTSGTKRIPTTTQERCSELTTEMRALLQGSKKSVLKFSIYNNRSP